jgi:ATPase subunit of ABC transporter with duplicated ATPase domains
MSANSCRLPCQMTAPQKTPTYPSSSRLVRAVPLPPHTSLSSHTPQRLGDIDLELEELTGSLSRVRSEEVLRGLGFKDSHLALPSSKLSGGWLMRIRLAAALLSKPDILLLDEPTNHLDLAGVVWLQEYITSNSLCPQTLVIVSHDESFLSVIATEVIVMKDKSLTYFSGSYDQYSPCCTSHALLHFTARPPSSAPISDTFGTRKRQPAVTLIF